MLEKIKQKSNITIPLIKFFLPFVIAIFGFLILYILVDRESIGKLYSLMFAYFIPPLGKESIIPIGVKGGNLAIPFSDKIAVIPSIDPLVMALSIAFVDIVVALFLVWNYDLAKKIPLIGKFIEKVEKIGKTSSDKYSWVKPLRFFGVILFVMVPFQGSGGMVGSILGRLIGMKPWNTFFAISAGSIIGCSLIAYFADKILSLFETNFLQGILVLIVILIICVMIFIYRKTRENNDLDKKAL